MLPAEKTLNTLAFQGDYEQYQRLNQQAALKYSTALDDKKNTALHLAASNAQWVFMLKVFSAEDFSDMSLVKNTQGQTIFHCLLEDGLPKVTTASDAASMMDVIDAIFLSCQPEQHKDLLAKQDICLRTPVHALCEHGFKKTATASSALYLLDVFLNITPHDEKGRAIVAYNDEDNEDYDQNPCASSEGWVFQQETNLPG